jgi:CheY-like chemotaxis protein
MTLSTPTKDRTILVIEDERALLQVIQEKLEKEGIRVITSRSVERAFSKELEENASGGVTMSSIELALNHIEELERVDAIWLDHNLLGSEDGLDFVAKLKANGGHWSQIPIFVVSNTSSTDLVHTYAKLGVSHYYVKAEHKLESIIADIHTELDRAEK